MTIYMTEEEQEHHYKEVVHLFSLSLTQSDIEDLKDAYDKHPCGIIEHILIQAYNHTNNPKDLPRRDSCPTAETVT